MEMSRIYTKKSSVKLLCQFESKFGGNSSRVVPISDWSELHPIQDGSHC